MANMGADMSQGRRSKRAQALVRSITKRRHADRRRMFRLGAKGRTGDEKSRQPTEAASLVEEEQDHQHDRQNPKHDYYDAKPKIIPHRSKVAREYDTAYE